MIKPEILKIYVRLCETLSFTKTAEALNIPKSTVSDSIRRLEEDVCTVLIKRTTRKVQITEDGIHFYEKALRLISDLIELQGAFSGRVVGQVRGRVRVDMPTAVAKNLILPNLPDFIEDFPEIDIEVGSSDRSVDLVADGIDFVIRSGKMKDSSLIARQVGEHRIVNCVGIRYIEKYGIPRTLKDLHNHYQVHYYQHFGIGKDGFEYYDGQKHHIIKTQSLLSVNNTISYHEACLAGLGIIQVPEVGVSEYLKSGEMIQILKKYKAIPMPVYIVYTNREYIPERVKIFMEWCESQLREYTR